MKRKKSGARKVFQSIWKSGGQHLHRCVPQVSKHRLKQAWAMSMHFHCGLNIEIEFAKCRLSILENPAKRCTLVPSGNPVTQNDGYRACRCCRLPQFFNGLSFGRHLIAFQARSPAGARGYDPNDRPASGGNYSPPGKSVVVTVAIAESAQQIFGLGGVPKWRILRELASYQNSIRTSHVFWII